MMAAWNALYVLTEFYKKVPEGFNLHFIRKTSDSINNFGDVIEKWETGNLN